jgi:hypothetical protein
MRWMGNSYRMYLCDIRTIQDKHRYILQATLQEVIDLITSYLVTTPDILGMSTVVTDDTMSNYIDDMDLTGRITYITISQPFKLSY